MSFSGLVHRMASVPSFIPAPPQGQRLRSTRAGPQIVSGAFSSTGSPKTWIGINGGVGLGEIPKRCRRNAFAPTLSIGGVLSHSEDLALRGFDVGAALSELLMVLGSVSGDLPAAATARAQ